MRNYLMNTKVTYSSHQVTDAAMVLTQKAVLLVNALQQGDEEYEKAKALVLQALQDLMRIFEVVPVAELVHGKGPHGSRTDELGTELSDLVRHGEIAMLKKKLFFANQSIYSLQEVSRCPSTK